MMFTAAVAEAAPAAAAEANQPQRWERDQRRNGRYDRRDNRRNVRRNVRTVTRTRVVRVGGQRYRETIQVRYLPNGRTQTRVISRVRIR
jgi:hypothetical protein